MARAQKDVHKEKGAARSIFSIIFVSWCTRRKEKLLLLFIKCACHSLPLADASCPYPSSGACPLTLQLLLLWPYSLQGLRIIAISFLEIMVALLMVSHSSSSIAFLSPSWLPLGYIYLLWARSPEESTFCMQLAFSIQHTHVDRVSSQPVNDIARGSGNIN